MSATILRDAPVKPVVIVPSVGWRISDVREIWAYRELLYFLAWKDLKLRYKQTLLGAGWALLQPLLTMVVFTVFFGRLGGLPSDGLPYPVFTYAALLPWMLFAHVVSQSSQSLVTHQDLVTKVYFPRLLLVLAPLGVGLVDFAVAFTVLLAMMLWYGLVPGPAVLALPLFVALASVAAVTVGVWLAACNVRYRDVRYALPFLTNLWLFASPVAYPASLVPERWRWLYGLNPMAGVIEGFRWALLGGTGMPLTLVVASSAATLILLVGGLRYFARLERTFADVV
ncbi:MAG TPA: ABC transporter permease [Candidatus Acidoferrum sp.]|nr:ABC transporter permease [Candidatus Acidoferrum sp.]